LHIAERKFSVEFDWCSASVEEGFDAGEQFDDFKRLCQIIVRAEF
jgi:hypothetical protein